MFRDSRGVVHTVSSAEPLADLPPGAAQALQDALLVPDDAVDIGSVLERCDAVRELVERWQDAFFAALPAEVDLEEEARWAAEAGLSLDDVEAGYEDEGEDEEDELDLAVLAGDSELEDLDDLLATEGLPDDDDEDDPRRVLPEELVTVLERELLLLPVRVRLEALVAAADLVAEWADLVADHEKLLGHLVLAHAEPQDPTAHETLVARHAALHSETGPGHADA